MARWHVTNKMFHFCMFSWGDLRQVLFTICHFFLICSLRFLHQGIIYFQLQSVLLAVYDFFMPVLFVEISTCFGFTPPQLWQKITPLVSENHHRTKNRAVFHRLWEHHVWASGFSFWWYVVANSVIFTPIFTITMWNFCRNVLSHAQFFCFH